MSAERQREIIAYPDGNPISVLIAEDETLIRLMAADSLRDAGLDVMAAASANEAIAVLEGAARVDFVLTDVMMPGTMNGLGLAHWIRARRPQLPIAFASGASRSRLIEMGLKDDDVLFAKPVDFDELVRHIRAAVAAARQMSASTA